MVKTPIWVAIATINLSSNSVLSLLEKPSSPHFLAWHLLLVWLHSLSSSWARLCTGGTSSARPLSCARRCTSWQPCSLCSGTSRFCLKLKHKILTFLAFSCCKYGKFEEFHSQIIYAKQHVRGTNEFHSQIVEAYKYFHVWVSNCANR